jgi:23S rRNA U2552 (ribose-2'-O)-methylase RlmE/FtsJ
MLPTTQFHLYDKICVVLSMNEPSIAISQSVAYYINEIKNKITTREKEWDIIKKYTNPYEFIHSVVPLRKKAVSKYRPLSRSYFKMVEIMSTFNIFPSSTAPIKSFHLAEGPGGFIEALCLKRSNSMDSYTGMTILYDEMDDNVPAWNKTEYFLSKNRNISIETGADGTGNIMRVENFDHCVNKYGSLMDLITADGGFDFTNDFNGQELTITNLLWGQICYALCLQNYGGNFVLKMFDCFYERTVDILYLLSSFYKEVNICKLQTSRSGNSEKYVVCRGFRMRGNADYLPMIRESFFLICQQNIHHSEHVIRFLNCTVPRLFVKHIEEMNSVFGTQQIDNIHFTISIIDKKSKYERLEQLTKQNVQRCITWCIDHDISYNNFTTTNIFIDREISPQG